MKQTSRSERTHIRLCRLAALTLSLSPLRTPREVVLLRHPHYLLCASLLTVQFHSFTTLYEKYLCDWFGYPTDRSVVAILHEYEYHGYSMGSVARDVRRVGIRMEPFARSAAASASCPVHITPSGTFDGICCMQPHCHPSHCKDRWRVCTRMDAWVGATGSCTLLRACNLDAISRTL